MKNITIVIYRGMVEAVYCNDPSAVTVTVMDRDIAGTQPDDTRMSGDSAAIEHWEMPEPYEAMPTAQCSALAAYIAPQTLESFTTQQSIDFGWDIADVQRQRPDLTDAQALEVLEHCQQHHDCEYGMSWTTIEMAAADLYPEPDNIDALREAHEEHTP